MKPAECRRLANEHTADVLASVIEQLMEERDPHVHVHGEDHGEKLTHALLARRIRDRIDKGEDAKDAFRAVMAEVRAVVAND